MPHDDATSAAPRARRWMPHWGWLLAAGLLAPAIFVAAEWRRSVRTRALVSELQGDAGVRLGVDDRTPQWVRQRWKDHPWIDRWNRVRSVEFESPTDESLRRLSALLRASPDITYLKLTDSEHLRDQWLAVGRLRQLRTLILERAGVTDADLALLGDLQGLFTLDVAGTQVSDAGLESVAKLSRLEDLCLFGTEVRGPGLARLGRLPELWKLSLAYCRLDDAETAGLRELKSLKHLVLDNTPIADGTVEHVAALERLVSLELCGTRITDRSLRQLESARQLRELDVRRTECTNLGVMEFHRRRPDVRLRNDFR